VKFSEAISSMPFLQEVITGVDHRTNNDRNRLADKAPQVPLTYH